MEEPGRFRVCEFFRRMNSAWTAPLLCDALLPDGSRQRIVLKLRDPGTPYGKGHHGATSLAAELITAMVARTVGVPVPDFGIADVSKQFVEAVTDRSVRELLQRNAGPNFATVYLAKITTWMPAYRSTSDVLRLALDKVVSLDATVMNGDRKRDKPNLLWDGAESVFPIDHSLAIPVYLWDDKLVESSPLLPDDQVRAHCAFDYLRGKACGFESVHRTWHARLSAVEWSQLTSVIPPEWETKAGQVATMLQFLEKRSQRFQDISSSLRGLIA